MPTATYEQLLTEALPGRIDSDEEYDRLHAQLGALLRKGKSRTPEETRLLDLLTVLVEDYDRRYGLPADKGTPSEILQFLLEHSGKTSADLLPVFGTRSHVSEALNGKRPISADQARRLGAIFSLKPGLFL
jgi:HTH-type transcriptional regulator/antitoxin HigA